LRISFVVMRPQGRGSWRPSDAGVIAPPSQGLGDPPGARAPLRGDARPAPEKQWIRWTPAMISRQGDFSLDILEIGG